MRLIELYLPSFSRALAYMLQACEYDIREYLRWLQRTHDFRRVAYRRELDLTRRARLVLIFLRLAIYLTMLAGLALILLAPIFKLAALAFFGPALIVAAPLAWAYLIGLVILLAQKVIIEPEEKRLVASSKSIFSDFAGQKIAIAGSYGKTTMKEILLTVLSEGKVVAATPGNKNVTSSHAKFAASLRGNEDILLVEFGEGKPGDVASYTNYIQPTHAVITGLAPAHLDKYQTLAAAASDIFSVSQSVPASKIYVNDEPAETKKFIKPRNQTYNRSGALGWRVRNVKLVVTGMQFELVKGNEKLELETGLLGEHLLGPLALAAGIASELGLSSAQIARGVAKTKPFEHRMQPYQLAGAWVIDDSYNGNLEGIRAGTGLLKKLPAKRKIYVTPGLVDQGEETERVHTEAGRLIAAAKPDEVILMQNSVTKFIKSGLQSANYAGKISIKKQPLEFYQNLEHILAAGDLIMLQNDWTDNYV